MSIRRVTLTSGQNVKPPFLYQYLISFNDFFFILDISLRSTLKPKKITDLKVYSNLSQALHKFSREKIALISISFNPLRDCLIGVGGWVVGHGSWVVGLRSPCIHIMYTYFYAVSNALSQQWFCPRSLSSVYTE